MDENELRRLGQLRGELRAELDQVMLDLRVAVVDAINAGELSEKAAASLTGASRMTIRAWLGK